jgi:hypothetical protein
MAITKLFLDANYNTNFGMAINCSVKPISILTSYEDIIVT